MTAVSEQTGQWLEEFTNQKPFDTPAREELRRAAFSRFLEMGFPTTHNEEWRFTNVAPIARRHFQRQLWEPKVELPAGVERLPEHEYRNWLVGEQHPFVALNSAFMLHVVMLRVPRGAVIQEPIRISNYACQNAGDPPVVHPRIVIVVGAGAHCTIVETYAGTGTYFTNAVTEIVAGDRAVVDHYKLQRESLEAFHVATLQAQLGRSTNFSTHNISLGAALARNDVGAVLAEGSEATLNGLYIAGGTQHVDNHTVIDHAMPHGTSHELYKGILDGKAEAVFNGRIIVRKDAQKTDSKQTNKNLVLSDNAVINTKPELQILADDVRCTHGATIGQLDAEAMFYLQSRGIGKGDARSLLTYAFAQDVVDRIKVQSLRDSLERVLFEKFHEHSEQ
jgi:Fe-S cluster assembly protein SufD